MTVLIPGAAQGRTIAVRRSDGKWATITAPPNVDIAAVKRGFEALRKGVVPFWLTQAEHVFMADIIGEFEDKAAESGGEGDGNGEAKGPENGS